MAGASDTFVTFGMLAAVGGGLAYITNFQGFKDWADSNLIQTGEAIGGDGGSFGGSFFQDPEGEPTKTKTAAPKPKPGTTFNCVSYPRCNSVAGTDARKKCCCTNKCSLMKKSNQTMSPTMNFSTGLCLCNFKTIPGKVPVGPCTGPCPPGKVPRRTSTGCACVACTITCGSCYDKTSACTCKFNANKISHSDAYCKSTCGGYSCWTNYPCPNRGARAQKCVKGNCTAARAAWIAAYACKSSYARAYHAGEMHYDRFGGANDILEQVPTIA